MRAMRRDAGNVLRLVLVALVALGVGWFGPQPTQPRDFANALLPAFPGAPTVAGASSIASDPDAKDREIAELRMQLAAMGNGQPSPAGTRADAVEDGAAASTECLPSSSTGVLVTGFQPLDANALLPLGLSESEQREVREIADAARLDYLRASHAIESAARQSSHDLRREITNRVGEHAYDAYLWASNQHNRLRVMRVVPGSAAARAGLQAGDELVSYDGRRVFDYADLRQDADASPSERMDLRWRHDGDARAATVPASDLGFVAVAERVRPQPE